MKSLELNRKYYNECVSGIIRNYCPDLAEKHAAALIGWGSEVLGNDDDYSKRYGWGPRVLLFLTPGDHITWGNKLLSIFQKHVPCTFLGHPTRYTKEGPPQPTENIDDSEVGIAITTCERFVEFYLGLTDFNFLKTRLSSIDWLTINEARLLRLTVGKVFFDGLGLLTEIRKYFKYFPDDVWRYKLAYAWTTLSWCIDLIPLCANRKDDISAKIAASKSIEKIIYIVFLLNKVYKPGYLKWIHREFYKLPKLAKEIGPKLDKIFSSSDFQYVETEIYAILDILIKFQTDLLAIPMPDYKSTSDRTDIIGKDEKFKQDPRTFKYDLYPVITAIRKTIKGELVNLKTKIGALDQWIIDEDLLMVPGQLQLFKKVYNCEDPEKIIMNRNKLEDKGI
jgi:hypothetical protein